MEDNKSTAPAAKRTCVKSSAESTPSTSTSESASASSSTPAPASSSAATPAPELNPLTTIAAMGALARGDLGPALGVSVGSKLQVLWSLAEDDGEEEELWWDCQVIRRTSEKHALCDPETPDTEEENAPTETTEKKTGKDEGTVLVPVYELKYAAMAGFDEAFAKVCLTDEHMLFDIEYDGIMPWRLAGSDWTPQSEEAPENSGKRKRTNQVLALFDHMADKHPDALSTAVGLQVGEGSDETGTPSTQVVENPRGAAEAFVDTLLGPILSKHGKALERLPASIQYHLADRVQVMKDRLVEEITTHFRTTGKTLGEAASKAIVEGVIAKLVDAQQS